MRSYMRSRIQDLYIKRLFYHGQNALNASQLVSAICRIIIIDYDCARMPSSSHQASAKLLEYRALCSWSPGIVVSVSQRYLNGRQLEDVIAAVKKRASTKSATDPPRTHTTRRAAS